jgi:hypothetical protein
MCAAMLVVLSLSATKRETYLLPLLPLLFLWLGIRSYEWWQHWQLRTDGRMGALWWLQVSLLCLWALAAPLAGWIWLKAVNPWILAALSLALIAAAALLYSSLAVQRMRAAGAALICAYVGAAATLVLAPPLLNRTKDMGPFVRWIGQQLPPGQPVYATGVDETLAAEIPYYAGRNVVPLDPQVLQRSAAMSTLPQWLLVQDNHDGQAVAPGREYVLVASRSFGAQRALLLWRRQAAAAAP